MSSLFSPQVNAVLQLIILVLILVSMEFKRRRKHVFHGLVMIVAVVANLLSFGLVMLPSLSQMVIIRTQPFHPISLATLGHSFVGIVAIILGIWLVVVWRLQSDLRNCFRNKKLMRLTIIVWLSSILIGFVLYSQLYLL